MTSSRLLSLFFTALPTAVVITTVENVMGNTHTRISWDLLTYAPESEPRKYVVELVSVYFFVRVTLGKVREVVARTVPGENYNITVTSINQVGETMTEAAIKIPAAGMCY